MYGDYVTGRVWSLQYDGKKVTAHKECSRLPTISSFGEDEAGELYVVSHGGAIYRMTAAE